MEAALERKEAGNAQLREQQYSAAVASYSDALHLAARAGKGKGKRAPPAADLAEFRGACFSNRSLAYLRLDQVRKALQDGQSAIEARPTWVKGYFRAAEALWQAGEFASAAMLYEQAALIDPYDAHVQKRLAEMTELVSLQNEAGSGPQRDILLGASVGGVCATALLFLSDSLNAAMQLFLVLGAVAMGAAGGWMKHWVQEGSKEERLRPPVAVRAASAAAAPAPAPAASAAPAAPAVPMAGEAQVQEPEEPRAARRKAKPAVPMRLRKKGGAVIDKRSK